MSHVFRLSWLCGLSITACGHAQDDVSVAQQAAQLTVDLSVLTSQVQGSAGNASAPVQHAAAPQHAQSARSSQYTSAAAAELAVHTVQGAGHLSPYQGQVVKVGPAIVTAVRGNGFYLQDETPDGDDATSEGIFVFTNAAPSVSVATRVVVEGTVSEFRPGCSSSCSPSASAFDNLTTTQLASLSISVLATDQPLPAAVVLGPSAGQRSVPLQVICDDATSGNVEAGGTFDPADDGIDFYESLEGMRVQLDKPQVIAATRTFQGAAPAHEIGVLASADAGLRSARGGILVAQHDFNPERLLLADALVSAFPSVNIGDAFDGPVVGVIDYTFANYKLLVSEPLPAVISGGLAQETTSLVADQETQLSIASMNVENLDALDDRAKFSAVAEIIVARMRSPDLIALEEVQDNNGPTNDGVVDATATLNALISAIANAGGPSYQYRQIDPVNNADGGEGGGNIRVAFLFRTDRGLAFVDRGSATSTTANSIDTSAGAPHLAFSPGRVAPGNSAWNSSRKPLAGEFTFRGRTLFAIANHFNSKGGDDPLFGRVQPPVLSSEAQRVQQASALADFVDSILAADSEALVVALGDFNDFSFSAALAILQDTGLVDLIHTLPANERYSYVYEGNSQDLDHILVSPALASLSSYDIVHVNAEFATQASDHDPAVMRIDLQQTEQSQPPTAAWVRWLTRIVCAIFPRACRLP